jgi:hypothetical protein
MSRHALALAAQNGVERLIDSATQHGQDSEPDHEVGDLQGFLRLAWEIMTPQQCDRFMREAEIWE